MKDTKKPRVLFFGNIPVANEERSVGGATVLAKNMLEFIRNNPDIQVTHRQIRTFWRYKLQLIDYLLWMIRFPVVIRKYDVISFHSTKDFHFTVAPVLWLWARLMRKRTVYHFFGGNFKERFLAKPRFQKWLIKKTILKSDVVFFETRALVDYFYSKGYTHSHWLPNARKPAILKKTNFTYQKRFVFISRVIPQKGIPEIIKAARQLPDDYIIDIYGPIDKRVYPKTIFQGEHVSYKGILDPEQIEDTLLNYDVLLLPSYFEGEGYPGIVIESLSLGIPSIVTYWKALPEVVVDKFNGRLIPTKDSNQLVEAMVSFNPENYPDYCKNALKSFEKFNSYEVFKKLIKSYIR